MIRQRSRALSLVLCLAMLMSALAAAMPAPAMAEVVAKQAGAAAVKPDQLPQSANPMPTQQMGQLQGEGIFGMAEMAIGVAAGVLIAVLIIWAVD